MAEIYVCRHHKLDKKAAHELLDEVAIQLAEKLDLQYEKKGDVLKFHRTGAHGSIKLTESEIIIEATLGMMLSMMKPALERGIHKTLDRFL